MQRHVALRLGTAASTPAACTRSPCSHRPVAGPDGSAVSTKLRRLAEPWLQLQRQLRSFAQQTSKTPAPPVSECDKAENATHPCARLGNGGNTINSYFAVVQCTY